MMTHNDPDVIKDSVNKYFTQITANEVSREYLDKKSEIGALTKDNQDVKKEPAGMEI